MSNVPLWIDSQWWGFLFVIVALFDVLHVSLCVRRCGGRLWRAAVCGGV